jgi:hypothetical protein
VQIAFTPKVLNNMEMRPVEQRAEKYHGEPASCSCRTENSDLALLRHAAAFLLFNCFFLEFLGCFLAEVFVVDPLTRATASVNAFWPM